MGAANEAFLIKLKRKEANRVIATRLMSINVVAENIIIFGSFGEFENGEAC